MRQQAQGKPVLTRVRWALMILLLSGVPRVPALEFVTPGEEEIAVDADSIGFDQRSNTVVATGHVLVRRGETELRANEIRLNRQTHDAEASGQVSLSDSEGVIFADHMQLNLDDETGALVQGKVYSRQLRYSLTGERIEKGLGQNYRIENGTFTTCHCEEGPPSWSVAGETLDVALDGYGILRNGTFKVLDIPIFYVPRAAFPVNRERQSGLLFPRVGVSNKRGFQILQPAYWAIDKSQDATVALDIETSARLGLVGEYRYAVSRSFRGEINATYFNEVIRGSAAESSKGVISNPEVPENRWSLITEHTQSLGSTEAYMDLQLTGDDLVLREINTLTVDHDQEVALRTRPFTESRAGVLQRWERVALQAEGVFYQDLIGQQSLALQQAPEIRVWGQKDVGFGLLGHLVASATDFQRSAGIAGLRADIEPEAELKLPLGRSLAGSLHATVRETAYQLTEDEMTGGFRGDDPTAAPVHLPSSLARGTIELGGDVGTGLGRTFLFPHFGLDKLKHTVEPRIEYLYIPSVDQDNVMIFDGLDRIGERSLITYGFQSRLLAREVRETGAVTGGAVRELSRLSISQSYDFNRLLPSAVRDGASSHFSDIDLAVHVNPNRWTTVRFVSNYDTIHSDFSAATVGFSLHEPRDRIAEAEPLRMLQRTTLGLSYRFITENPLKLSTCGPGELDCGIQQVDANMMVRLTERFGLLYATRYNVREDRFLENHVGMNIQSSCDCWGLDIGVTNKSNPRETEFRAQLTLAGLGSSGGLKPKRRE